MKSLFSEKHIATTALVALNVVLFFAMVATTGLDSLASPPLPALIEWGANFGPLTLTTEPWRLITCAFVHGNLIHLVLNMYTLAVVGSEVEKSLGTLRFLYAYFFSAVIGALVSVELQPTVTSVGASGAVFGIFGAAFSYVAPGKLAQVRATWKRRVIVLSAFMALNLAFSFIVPGIDNAAHVGGLIGGLAAGLAVSASSSRRFKDHAFAITGLLLAIPLVCYLLMFKQYEHDPRLPAWVPITYGQALVNEKKYDEAIPYFDRALKSFSPDSDKDYYHAHVAALLVRTNALTESKRYAEALKDIVQSEKILEAHDKEKDKTKIPILTTKAGLFHHLSRFDEAAKLYSYLAENNKEKKADALIYNNLAWSQLASGQLDDALKNVNKSLESNKDETTTIDTRATAYLLMQKYDEALADLNRALRIKPKEGALYFHRAGVYLAKGNMTECDKDLKTAREFKYTPDNWEPNAFPELCSRYEQVRN